MTRTLRDSEECLQRIEQLARKIAQAATVPNELGVKTCHQWQDEARAIVAELDLTDDALAARTIAREAGYKFAEIGNAVVTLIERGVAKGRELERAEQEKQLRSGTRFENCKAVLGLKATNHD